MDVKRLCSGGQMTFIFFGGLVKTRDKMERYNFIMFTYVEAHLHAAVEAGVPVRRLKPAGQRSLSTR